MNLARMTRRGSLALLATLAMTSLAAAQAPTDGLAAEAAKLGEVIWYESSPDAQADKILAAFHKRYPGVKARHIRDTGGNAMSSRIIQEMQGNAQTADIGTNSASVFWPLVQRGLLEKVDWQALGADAKLAPTPYSLLTTASVYVILSNTAAVTEADAPKNWDALLDPKWRGKLGTWFRSEGLVSLASAWGPERITEYVGKLAQQQPFLFPSTFPLAQQVGAGEVVVGLGIYHSAQPAIARGAPLRTLVPEPAPISSLYSFIPSAGRNKPGGKLLALWLASPEGAKAYEDATSRGNPLIASTKTAQLLAGHTIAEYTPDQADTALALLQKYNTMLADGAKSAGR